MIKKFSEAKQSGLGEMVLSGMDFPDRRIHVRCRRRPGVVQAMEAHSGSDPVNLGSRSENLNQRSSVVCC